MTVKEKILDIIQDTDKNYNPYYDVIPKLINERGYKSGIEIGIFCGGHAKRILESTNVETLIGIDPYECYTPGMPRMETQEDYNIMHDIVMERLQSNMRYIHIRMTSDEAFERIKNNKYDFIFIDGLHTYDQLKKDLANYSTLIKKGGIISCHDYNHPYFPRLTNAIDEFAKEHNTKVVVGPLHLIYMEKTWK